MYTALTIAGSDSSGGAGIQADLKTFAACGVYGTSAITAITAQNTQGVLATLELPTDLIAAQIDAIMSDIAVASAKTGMLSSVAIIEMVSAKVRERLLTKLVVDPVMVATSGHPLLRQEAVDTLKRALLPLAYVITPNLPEVHVLTGREVSSVAGMRWAAQAIHQMGPTYVVVKGGHLKGEAVDILYDGSSFHEFRQPRVNTRSTHGTGCTFSAAITAGLAKGQDVVAAVGEAKAYISGAIRTASPIGHGHGPVNHFWQWQEQLHD